MEEISLLSLLQKLYLEHYTGSLVIHIHQGVPNTIEYGRPISAKLTPIGTKSKKP